MQGEKGEDAIIPVGVDVTIIFKGLKGMQGRKGIPGGEGSDGSKGQYGDRVIIQKTYQILQGYYFSNKNDNIIVLLLKI